MFYFLKQPSEEPGLQTLSQRHGRPSPRDPDFWPRAHSPRPRSRALGAGSPSPPAADCTGPSFLLAVSSAEPLTCGR